MSTLTDYCRNVSGGKIMNKQPTTDTKGSPSGQINWRHLSAVQRELLEQNGTMPAEVLVGYPEIVAVERRVAASLYPPKGGV